MSYIFNYIDFYNYYINPTNVITDTNDCVSLYYFTDSDKIKKVRKKKRHAKKGTTTIQKLMGI